MTCGGKRKSGRGSKKRVRGEKTEAQEAASDAMTRARVEEDLLLQRTMDTVRIAHEVGLLSHAEKLAVLLEITMSATARLNRPNGHHQCGHEKRRSRPEFRSQGALCCPWSGAIEHRALEGQHPPPGLALAWAPPRSSPPRAGCPGCGRGDPGWTCASGGPSRASRPPSAWTARARP